MSSFGVRRRGNPGSGVRGPGPRVTVYFCLSGSRGVWHPWVLLHSTSVRHESRDTHLSPGPWSHRSRQTLTAHRCNDMGRHINFLTRGASSFQLTCDVSWHMSLRALMSIWPIQARIKMRRHQARDPRSLLPDLPDFGWRLGTLTLCLLILGVRPLHHTGSESPELSPRTRASGDGGGVLGDIDPK